MTNVRVPENCPFCKRKPQIGLGKKVGCQLHGDPSQTVTVSCTRQDCPARPFVQAGDVYNGGKAQATLEAVELWNRCSPAPAYNKGFYDGWMACGVFQIDIDFEMEAQQKEVKGRLERGSYRHDKESRYAEILSGS